MSMFCDKCGSSVSEGSKFCLKCGNRIQASAPATAPPVPPPAVPPSGQEEDRKKKAGFFYSPAGIILMVVIGLAVLGGLTIGAIFLFKGDSHNTVDAATVDVWEEYAKISEGDGKKIAQIDMNPDNLNQAKADLENSQKKLEGLQKVAVKTTGSGRTTGNKPPPPGTVADTKANEMEAILEAYEAYIGMMNEFLGTLVGAITGNQLINPDVINNLNGMLAELQELASVVKTAMGGFLDPQTKEILVDEFPDFDPGEIMENPVFLMAESFTPQIEQGVAEAQAAEAARLEAEKQAAEAEAARIEAERQAAAAAAAQQKASQRTWGPIVANPCGDTSCTI